MFRKILILMILLCISNIVFAKSEKLTRQDYLIKLKNYTKECNQKLDEIEAQYEKETTPKIELLKKLKGQVYDVYMNYSNCQQNDNWNSLANGPCGHLMNKPTYFKTSSGLVVADDDYAVNKCLAKLPRKQGGFTPAKACQAKYNAYKKMDNEIKTLEKELSTLKTNKKLKTEKIMNDAFVYGEALYEECKKMYPNREAIYGYCQDVKVTKVNK